MSFIEADLPLSVTTGYESPVRSVFIPILLEATKFDVGVGYFTSGWLRDAAPGIAEFAVRGGRSRWVVSPELQPDDLNAMLSAKDAEEAVQYAEMKIEEVIMGLRTNTREELCAMIAAGVLEFRIAVPRSRQGLFHAKIIIATDSAGNRIACSGSYNLTGSAESNWEHIDVFGDWRSGEEARVDLLKNHFERLWDSNDPSYEVKHPTKELLGKIKALRGARRFDFPAHIESEGGKSDDQIELRDYQQRAIDQWGANNGRGTYVMATGTGKTVTALATVRRLEARIVAENGGSLVTVIVVPLKHLLDQWASEAQSFGFDVVKCYEKSADWKAALGVKLGAIKAIGTGHLVVLVTNATLGADSFRAFMNSISSNFLFIADEAHNLGARSFLQILPSNANFRLALSATPKRYKDDFGSEKLLDYFGRPVIEFGLNEAISGGFLCPYNYIPSVCEMSDSEYEEYLSLSAQIRVEAEKSQSDGERTKEHDRLLRKRADLMSRVASKLSTLEDQLKARKSEGEVLHTLVYCGSRRGADEKRHIERTVEMIGNTVHLSVRRFTASESKEERQQMLKLFAMGELGVLAAIKCLDEGVDVPATRYAYILASTLNPREYIQRRGRVLRRYPGKSHAVIYDYIVTPPSKEIDASELLGGELERAWEFADLALNREDCSKLLDDLSREYRV